MKRQLTFTEYRSLDLTLFAVMLAVSEYIITSAATWWFPGQPFSVSITGAMCAIVLMRWGAWAAIHAVLGGIVICTVSGASAQQYVVYCIGNLFCLFSLGLLRWIGSETIRKDKLLAMLFALLTLVFMQIGRGIMALLLGTAAANFWGFLTTDALSGLFAMVIVYIVRNLDGIFENQKIYLIRLQKQNEKGRQVF